MKPWDSHWPDYFWIGEGVVEPITDPAVGKLRDA